MVIPYNVYIMQAVWGNNCDDVYKEPNGKCTFQ